MSIGRTNMLLAAANVALVAAVIVGWTRGETTSAVAMNSAPRPILETIQPALSEVDPASFTLDFSGAWEGPGYIRGASEARVTVIEFSDFGCPFCGKFAVETYPALHKEFVESGKVRWIYVPFVMGMFPNGNEAALAAECAAQSSDAAFWKMHDRLYETQHVWKRATAPAKHFQQLATEIGLNRKDFAACYADSEPAGRIAASNDLAQQAKVRATPTFFVQGKRIEGALPLPMFRALLSDASAKANGPR